MNEHFKMFLDSRFNQSYIEEIKMGSEYNDLYAAYIDAYYRALQDVIVSISGLPK